jgi:hypothetical protein
MIRYLEPLIFGLGVQLRDTRGAPVPTTSLKARARREQFAPLESSLPVLLISGNQKMRQGFRQADQAERAPVDEVEGSAH